MKKTTLALCLLMVAATLCTAVAPTFAQQKKPVFAFDRKFMPFTFVRNKKPIGFEIDIINAALEGTGLAVEFKPMRNWNRAQAELSNGKVNIAAGMTQTTLRAKLFSFTRTPTVNLELRFFANRVSGFKHLGQIRGRTVATIRDSLYQRLLQEFGGIKIKLYETGEEALNAVQIGDAQAFFGADKIAMNIIERENMQNLVFVGAPLKRVPMYFAFYKGDDELRDIVEQGIKRIKSNGEYDRIYRKWFIKEISSAKARELTKLAQKELPMAYAPYSLKPESAVVMTATGNTYTGTTVETKAPGNEITAFEAAISKAMAAGDVNITVALKVSHKGRVLPPSARDRRLLKEFGRGVLVVLEPEPNNFTTWTITSLLPFADGMPGYPNP